MDRPKQWWYIIIDHDAKTFYNMGRVTSEVDWNLKIVDARKAGRNLRTEGPWTDAESVRTEIHYINEGYTKVSSPPL